MEKIETPTKPEKKKRKPVGRPRGPVRKVSVNYRVSEENRDWINEYALATGFSISTVINKAVDYYRFAVERTARRSARG